ncbi:MAG: outer membrane beta-barrel protein [Rikenellaceae bacterium]
MKRISKIFAVAALLIVSATLSVNAQVYYGVKAGANVSTVGISDALEDISNNKSAYGFQVGGVLGAKIPIIGIGVEAEALWVNNKMSLGGDIGEVVSNSIEVPVMASIPVLPLLPISLKVGPSFVLYNKAKSGDIDLGEVKSNVGYTIGLGLKVSKITFDVRFNGQFTSSSPFANIISNATNIDVNDSIYNIRANTFSASLGYLF